MVSASVSASVSMPLIPDKIKVNAKLYVETLLPKLVQECRSVLPSGFIFQQDTWQIWLKSGLLPTAVNSLVKMNGLRTRLTLTPLDYHICGAMFEPSWKIPMSSRK